MVPPIQEVLHNHQDPEQSYYHCYLHSLNLIRQSSDECRVSAHPASLIYLDLTHHGHVPQLNLINLYILHSPSFLQFHQLLQLFPFYFIHFRHTFE